MQASCSSVMYNGIAGERRAEAAGSVTPLRDGKERRGRSRQAQAPWHLHPDGKAQWPAGIDL